MVKYLTRYGIAALREKIAFLQRKRDEALRRAGEAAQGDTNAYHDNFEYEEGMRQQEIFSERLRSLDGILEGATVAPEPEGHERAAIGHYVVLRRQGAEEPEGYVLCGDGEGALLASGCSVSSPLGEALLEMAAGETKTVLLAGRPVTIELLEIRPATPEDMQLVEFDL